MMPLPTRQWQRGDGPPPRHLRPTGGFTLIEVMVAVVLTSMLVLGMAGLWNMVSDQFFQLTLRQKAILALHGSMERVSALYRNARVDPNILTPNTTGYPVLTGRTAADDHIVFNSNASTLDFIEITAANFEPSNLDAAELAALPGQVLIKGSGSATRNVVFLDVTRRVTAQVSWRDEGAVGGICANNLRDDDCHQLVLYLDYPYRFPQGGDELTPMRDQVETLVLRTLVGAR